MASVATGAMFAHGALLSCFHYGIPACDMSNWVDWGRVLVWLSAVLWLCVAAAQPVSKVKRKNLVTWFQGQIETRLGR